jgi:hypothetical protein
MKESEFMADIYVQKVIDHLWRATDEKPLSQRYALLDAARSEKIYAKLLEANVPAACLFQGDKARELAHVAPYLVQLQQDTFTRWLLENGWGKSWGIFAVSAVSLERLKHHFRSLLTVYDEEGNSLFFRYYDPRVLRVYLPTCMEGELETIYGPVVRYYLEGREKNKLIEYTRTERFELVEQSIDM